MQTRRTTVSRLFTSSLPESLRGLLPFTDDTFSSASFPIPSRDKTVAIITLYNPGHDCFQTSETRLLAYFFNHLVNNQREADPSSLGSTPANTVSIQTLSRIYRYYALGSLTTGLAHELTDLSNGAINYTQALLDLTDDQPQTMEPKALLDKLLAEEKKMSRLAVDLQQFSRDTVEESRQYSVQELLQPIDTLTKGQARAEGIELQVSIDPGLPLIPKNGPDIQLVILSLIQNARNRISAKYPGGRDKKKKIQIRATLAQQKAHNQVLITVQDQGTSWPSLEPAQNDSGSAPEPWLELHPCRLFLQNFGGDLVIESDSDQKNICSLFLPC
jgi:signal transduction histidine kinase